MNYLLGLILLVFVVADGLGVDNGNLAPCPDKPNCVSTQADAADAEHYMPPIEVEAGSSLSTAQVRDLIEARARTKIISQTDTYIHAEFRSQIMRFVDDVEFYLDTDAGLLHFRSASRVGQSDMGVNRKRMGELSAAIRAIN